MIHRPSSKKEQLQVSLFSKKKCTKKCSCKEYFLKKRRKRLQLQKEKEKEKEKMERELERERLELEQEELEDDGDEDKNRYNYTYTLFNWLKYSSYPPLIYIPR